MTPVFKLLDLSRGNIVRDAWDKLARVPKGNVLYSRLLGRLIPYTGTIPSLVEELGGGKATVSMRDVPGVRNHLRSIHAVALANLGELATGLALNYMLPPRARCILTALRMDYVKKARGQLRARAWFDIPEWGPHQEVHVRGEIVDPKGEVVAKVSATWLVDAL
jgi:acyl-coenzyme A thioesterase PaaI-like protein